MPEPKAAAASSITPLRALASFVLDVLQAIAEEQTGHRICRRCGHAHDDGRPSPCGALLMRMVLERGAGNLRTAAQCKTAGTEWGFCGSYVSEAAKVAAWDHELAGCVVAREYPLVQAIKDEQEQRLGPWHLRHPEAPPPLPGPDATEAELRAATLDGTGHGVSHASKL